MPLKFQEYQKAIELRKTGLSYTEILQQVHVAKSTLSLWLRSVGLSKCQKQRLTERKLASIKRGWQKWRGMRLQKVRELKQKAYAEIGEVSKRELWLIGTALYWAEGSKEKENNVGQGLTFCNSDSQMIKFYLRWLEEVLKVQEDNIKTPYR